MISSKVYKSEIFQTNRSTQIRDHTSEIRDQKFAYCACMFGLLHQYLVENRSVYLRGTGQLQLIHQPASFDVTNNLMHAPCNSIRFQNSEQAGSLQPLMSFLSRQLNIAEENAFSLYEAFCNQLQLDIESRQEVNWTALGIFKKDATGNTVFIADQRMAGYNQPVEAIRVIRHGAPHQMMVGTRETTNTAMKELLGNGQSESITTRSRWWIPALLLGLAALVLILLKKMNAV